MWFGIIYRGSSDLYFRCGTLNSDAAWTCHLYYIVTVHENSLKFFKTLSGCYKESTKIGSCAIKNTLIIFSFFYFKESNIT